MIIPCGGWMEITVEESDPAAHEAISAYLLELGCDGIVEDPGTGASLKAYLPEPGPEYDLRARVEAFLRELASIFPDAGRTRATFSTLPHREWGLAWRAHFRPERVTPGLLILPAWEKDVPLEPGCSVIRMDPGPAFGTGKHPTTRMCLRALEDLSLPGPWDMLDIGTGSGILAVYASILGARRVTAVDSDPEALRWAEWNIRLNGLTARIRLSSTPPEALDEAFQVAAANLDLKTIVGLCPWFPRVVRKGGTLILSGILAEDAQRVKEAVEEQGFSIAKAMDQEEWACLVARAEQEGGYP